MNAPLPLHEFGGFNLATMSFVRANVEAVADAAADADRFDGPIGDRLRAAVLANSAESLPRFAALDLPEDWEKATVPELRRIAERLGCSPLDRRRADIVAAIRSRVAAIDDYNSVVTEAETALARRR